METNKIKIKVSENIMIEIGVAQVMSVTEFITFTEQLSIILNNVKPLEVKKQSVKPVEQIKVVKAPYKKALITPQWTKERVDALRKVYGTMSVPEIQRLLIFNGLPLSAIYNKASDMGLTNKVKRLGIRYAKN
jgi:hypothetical protein